MLSGPENPSIPVSVTTKKETIKTPQKQIMIPTILPKKVFGKISPYPTEVRVIITFHIQLIMLPKSYPLASNNYLSNSLN